MKINSVFIALKTTEKNYKLNLLQEKGSSMEDNSKSVLLEKTGENEKILWQGKPDKRGYILNVVFNRFLFIAIIWLFGVIIPYEYAISHGYDLGLNKYSPTYLIWAVFWGLLPVWLYLGYVIMELLNYKNTEFLLTDKGMYSSCGIFSTKVKHKTYNDIKLTQIYKSIINNMIGFGTVVCSEESNKDSNKVIMIRDIPDYENVHNLINEHIKN